MKVIVQYQAEDGTIFNTEKDCLDYEATADIRAAAKVLREYCHKFEDCHSSCIFCKHNECMLSEFMPQSWEIE